VPQLKIDKNLTRLLTTITRVSSREVLKIS